MVQSSPTLAVIWAVPASLQVLTVLTCEFTAPVIKARSAKQSIVKSLFSVTSQAWRGLDPAERISWKTLAGSLGKSAFGFRLFSHYYLDALHSGITPATSAPDPNSGFRVADPNFHYKQKS